MAWDLVCCTFYQSVGVGWVSSMQQLDGHELLSLALLMSLVALLSQ